MMNLEGLTKYLEESGLVDRIEGLKPGDKFGVEIPIDEENDKWLRFWLSADSEDDKNFITLNFERLVTVRVCADEKALEDWVTRSGFLELAELAGQIPEESKTEEVTA